ncbi:MAG: hypothetical protein ACLFQ8_01430 [Candidatus Aenigmatarchaeota archaeon]
MDNDKLLTSVHAIMGAVSGYLSNFTGQPSHALAVAIAILLVTGNVSRYLADAEDKGAKWWLGNSVAPFFLIWAVFAVLFYNL